MAAIKLEYVADSTSEYPADFVGIRRRDDDNRFFPLYPHSLLGISTNLQRAVRPWTLAWADKLEYHEADGCGTPD